MASAIAKGTLNNMRHRHLNRFSATLVAVAIIAALVLVMNPELRALLLFTDSLGLDLIALLAATQFKSLVYASAPAARVAYVFPCRILFSIGHGAIRIYPRALEWRPFDKLVCPVLVFVTFGIRCRSAN
jgi:hypothetical protein